MCFSAKASFLAGGLLLPMGAAALQISWAKADRQKVPLAIAPLLFGLQQLLEGGVWLGVQAQQHSPFQPLPPSSVATALAYLFFAYAFWPVWIPWAAISLLPRPGLGSNLLARALPLLGLTPGLVLWLPLLSAPQRAFPMQVGQSLDYHLHPWSTHLLPPLVGPVLYAGLIVVPLFLVPSIRVRTFALTLLVAFAISLWANTQTLTSVWCYASALLSAQILWILQEAPGNRKETPELPQVQA